jgi:predicted nucleic-acid-binding protein
MKAVDTNILVRLILNDDIEQLRRIKELIVSTHHAGQQLFVPQVVVQELIWVLQNNLGIPKQKVVRAIDGILSLSVWDVEHAGRIGRAIQIYEEHDVDFTDACLAAISYEKNIEGVLSFDRDMGKIGARWIRP